MLVSLAGDRCSGLRRFGCQALEDAYPTRAQLLRVARYSALHPSAQTSSAPLDTVWAYEPGLPMMSTAHRMNVRDISDATVPIRFIKDFEHESLRWPPHLDHGAIVGRLVAIRESAPWYRGALAGLEHMLAGVESMSTLQIAGSVLAALVWTWENPGYGFLAEQLQIVAVNMKNLK